MTVLHLTGTHYEQGVQQGSAMAAQIARNWAQIRDLIGRLIGGRDDWYRGLLATNRRHIACVDPDTLEELEGIAAGSGLPLDDVQAMNLPIYMSLRRARITEECSVYAVGSQATRDGCTYLVKTRDQPVDQFQFDHVVLHRNYTTGESLVEVNAAGIITNPGNGMNDAGLAVGTAGSWSRERMTVNLKELGEAHSQPDMHFLLRNAGSIAEAHRVLASTPRLAGMNIVVADSSGAVATVEVTADDALLTRAESGIAALTNHYVHPDLQWANDPPEQNPSSHTRYHTITGFLDRRRGSITSRDLTRLSMDHAHGPQDSVCRHSPDGQGSTTRYVSLMAVEDFDTWTFCDNPCRMALVAGRETAPGSHLGNGRAFEEVAS